jgi:hypothetical protein
MSSAYDWVVGIEQRQPYEWLSLETFSEEGDALAFAATWIEARAGHRISKRTWLLAGDDKQRQRLLVRRVPR